MDIDEIEDIVNYNKSYGISVRETLKDLNKLYLMYLFLDYD